jgi:capsular polysaccharide biosynthesis protein
VDRVGALWRAKWWILGATLLVTLATFAIATLVPAVYASTAQVSLSAVPGGSAAPSDLVTAGNDLAAQYAELVKSTPVLAAAAAQTGASVQQLRGHTSAGTPGSQNVIAITVQAASPSAAEREARSVASALVNYVGTTSSDQVAVYSKAVQNQLLPLNAEIAQASAAVDKASADLNGAAQSTNPAQVSAASARLTAAQSLLTTLTDRRAALEITAALQGTGLSPNAQLLGDASAAAKVQPRPVLYAGIAAVIALAVSIQIAIVAAERRRRLAHSAARAIPLN